MKFLLLVMAAILIGEWIYPNFESVPAISTRGFSGEDFNVIAGITTLAKNRET
jgi:hypothetical protein